MPTAEIVRSDPKDLLRALGEGVLYHRSREHNMSLTRLLDLELKPEAKSELDGFDVLMREAGIKTRSIPEVGVVADTVEAFAKDRATKYLFGEWAHRVWRRATGDPAMMGSGRRALYESGDAAAGQTLNQIVFAAQPRFKQIAPAVPISEVVAMTTPITGGTYEAYYLTDTTAQERMARVAEGTEVPTAKLSGGDQVIRLRKFGRAVEWTYEQMRRMRIDVVALYLARLAVQAEVDKLAVILDVIVNGDGNSGTSATNYNLTTLDSGATAGTLSVKGWATFKAKFRNPYRLGVVLAQEAPFVQMELLNMGSANVPLVTVAAAQNLGQIVPIVNQTGDNVRLGLTDDAPTLKLVGLDERFGIERVVEVNSDISETVRWIESQRERLVMTFNEGYKVFDQNALKILNINA